MATQDDPIRPGNDYSNDAAKIDGVVDHRRSDVAAGSLSKQDVPKVLSKWLADAGIALEPAEIDQISARITAG